MGQCTSCQKRGPISNKQMYYNQPKDTEQYASKNLQKLKFQGIFSNLKIKNCFYVEILIKQDELSIKIDIQNIETFLLNQKAKGRDQTIFWSFEQRFGLELNQYELRKSFVILTFYNGENMQVGLMRINLYLISSGPYHQDYALKLKKGENMRISFDLKISQVIQISLESLNTEIDLSTKHPGQKFCYSIKTIIGNNHSYNMSQPSFTVRVMLDDKQELQISEKSRSQKNIPRGTSAKKLAQKHIPAEHNLQWTNQNSKHLPSIMMKTLVSQLHHSYFQILLWKIKDSCQINQEQTMQSFGQCYIALHKLFSVDPINEHSQSTKQLREIQWKEKMWHHGKQIGHGKFRFNVENDKYIKQMQVMVRTQQGIMVYSPVFFDNKSKSNQCPQLKKINHLITLIQDNVVKLENRTGGVFQSRMIKVQIEQQLLNLVEILNKSNKQSIVCFSYTSQSQFIQAQQILIKLGMEMMSWLQQEDQLINQLCWKILIALLKRGEFLLTHLKVEKNHQKQINKKTRQIKTEVGVMYQKFLYKQLQLALQSLNVKGLQVERTFAEAFCALAYFRIPEFRTKLLDAITKSDDPSEIPQWRGTQFYLNDDEINYQLLSEQVNTFSLLCDWEHSFYSSLENQPKFAQNKLKLLQILSSHSWKQRLAKRSAAFFYFIVFWVEYIESIVVKTKDIQWKYFPGYNRIIKCFLIQLKTRNIREYPDALKTACYKLLSNQKLLNALIMIVLSKCNLYDAISLFKTIEFIHKMLDTIKKNKRNIPPTFNYIQFYKVTKTILQSDSSFAVSKMLILLYTHFELFNFEFRRKILLLLFGMLYFDLLLHWSHNVRDVFCHFMIYKVIFKQPSMIESHSYIDIMFQQQFMEDIKSKYLHNLTIIEQQIAKKKTQQIYNLTAAHEKNLYKTMKKKLRKLKRKNQICQQSTPVQKNESEIYLRQPQTPIEFKRKSIQEGLIDVKQNSIIHARTQRSRSEVLDHKLVHSILKSKANQIDEVNRLKAKKSTFSYEIFDTTKGTKTPIKRNSCRNLINKSIEDFMIGNIKPQQRQYMEIALLKLKKIEQNSQKITINKQQQILIPVLQIQMPVDIKQIRPDSIDDW